MTAHPPRKGEHNSPRRPALRRLLLLLLICGLLPSTWQAVAQVNGVGQRPYLGWSTFSEQTINGNFLTQANIQAQSDALRSFRVAVARLPIHQHRLRLAGKL